MQRTGKKNRRVSGNDALLDRLDPAAIHADGDLVLGLARDRARVTADALSADRSRSRSWASGSRQSIVSVGSRVVIDSRHRSRNLVSDYTTEGILARRDLPVDQRKRRQSMCSNSGSVSAVNLRRERLMTRCRFRVRRIRREARATSADLSKTRRSDGRDRQWQAIDHGDGDVRAHPQANEIVRDEAVEHAAQKMLHVVVERCLQTEERVRRHDSGREDGRDERQPVGRRGDIAVCEPRTRISTRRR